MRQTFVAELVPPAKLSNAVGLNSASFNAARLIGPGIAGLAIAGVGIGWVFVINAVTFAATILSLTRMRRLRAAPDADRARARKGQIREGVAYVRGRSDILVIMVVVGVVSTFGLNFQLTSAMMARTEFGKGAGEYGILGSILAIGSLTGALLAARRERPRVRLVIGSAFAFGDRDRRDGADAHVRVRTPSPCIPVGFASLTMMTAANSTIQMSTDPAVRGRVMALYMMVFLGATPIGSPDRRLDRRDVRAALGHRDRLDHRDPRVARRGAVGPPGLGRARPLPPAQPAPRRRPPARRGRREAALARVGAPDAADGVGRLTAAAG